jgi:hypothetical protein
MTHPFNLTVFALSLAVGFALMLPASAEPTEAPAQKKQIIARHSKNVNLGCSGQEKFRCGPLYFQGYYLGDDPDPFIRLQIARDLKARFPR